MKTLFETDRIKVYKNSSYEIFHLNKLTGVVLRIDDNSNSTTITYDAKPAKLSKPTKYRRVIITPTSINGKSAIKFERIDFN